MGSVTQCAIGRIPDNVRKPATSGCRRTPSNAKQWMTVVKFCQNKIRLICTCVQEGMMFPKIYFGIKLRTAIVYNVLKGYFLYTNYWTFQNILEIWISWKFKLVERIKSVVDRGNNNRQIYLNWNIKIQQEQTYFERPGFLWKTTDVIPIFLCYYSKNIFVCLCK